MFLFDNYTYTKLYEYDINGNLVYEGWAKPGTISSIAGWKIKKITWVKITTGWLTNNYEIAGETWASDCIATNIWDNRATYTYL